MNASSCDLQADLAELESAEDFLEYFNVSFDPAVLHVNRLHILQRFHNYLERGIDTPTPSYEQYRAGLKQAYEDFVHSDALTEKVFRVHQRASGVSFVPLSSIVRARH